MTAVEPGGYATPVSDFKGVELYKISSTPATEFPQPTGVAWFNVHWVQYNTTTVNEVKWIEPTAFTIQAGTFGAEFLLLPFLDII